MQIILVQAEIEKAIRNYVNSKVQVNEGQDIRIDLSASRGPEGFRATIDIVDEDATTTVNAILVPAPVPKAAALKVAAEAGEDQAAAKAKAAEAEAKKKAEAERAAAAAAQVEAEKKALETADSSATEPPFEPEIEEEVQEVQEPTSAAAAPRKPLFGRSNAALNA